VHIHHGDRAFRRYGQKNFSSVGGTEKRLGSDWHIALSPIDHKFAQHLRQIAAVLCAAKIDIPQWCREKIRVSPSYHGEFPILTRLYQHSLILRHINESPPWTPL
jgi:hypothetical protein